MSEKSCIRERKNFLTDADSTTISRTDTILERLHDLSQDCLFFRERKRLRDFSQKKIVNKSWENPGKTTGKPRETPGKPRENPEKTPEKPREYPGKATGKPWENPGKTLGKPQKTYRNLELH